MALEYKLQYTKMENGGHGVYINLKTDVPDYRNLVGKEDYDKLPEEEKSEFMTGLIEIDGVCVVSAQRYRAYVEKGDAFTWDEVLPAVLNYLKSQTGHSELLEQPGSGIQVEPDNVRTTADNRKWRDNPHTLST